MLRGEKLLGPRVKMSCALRGVKSQLQGAFHIKSVKERRPSWKKCIRYLPVASLERMEPYHFFISWPKENAFLQTCY